MQNKISHFINPSLHNILLHSTACISTFVCLDIPMCRREAFAHFVNPFPSGFDWIPINGHLTMAHVSNLQCFICFVILNSLKLNVVSVSKKMERDLDEEAESQIGFQKVL
jgi:hypothetical protein